MSGVMGFHAREAIRVNAKKCGRGEGSTEQRKFSLDPQITSFEVLQSLLARAFDIQGEFTVSYLARDDEGGDAYLGLLSDWDLDAAFLSSSEPCLKLRIEPKPYDKSLAEWDVVTPGDMAKAPPKPSLTGTLLSQMEKTLSRFQRVLNLAALQESAAGDCMPPPLGDREFRACLDGEGRLLKPRELRLAIYKGGVEPSLRKVVWKHILNVYPDGLTGRQRLAYMRRKSDQYVQLRTTWKALLDKPDYSGDIQLVTNMVRKDVLRTDRTNPFYAGGDDNANVVSLFNLLTTFALNHPTLSYCQGMSDLASPLLVVMRDEPHAYVCFCALMRRLAPNFNLDGEAMTLKFQHLSDLVEHFDPVFFRYLEERGAQDLLFCYRWLLLELKREFAFDDALRMLEVLWSSLPPSPPEGELPLFERPYQMDGVGPPPPRVVSANPYSKVRAIRRQSSPVVRGGPSSDDEDEAYERDLDSGWCNGGGSDSDDKPSNHTSEGYVSEGASSREASTDDSSGIVPWTAKPKTLPRPQELGGGNPFMMFLCLTLLMQHRDVIMRNSMDYNELAMHFDKMVRRHRLQKVLQQTRALYTDYLRLGWDEHV
ncbi:TBC1 domain family member 25-like isoform X1 [Dermacentor variabilis]|uniref:TBC1 domain family member 25-like isoform X1 n=2 Tax=Dermacentor variabilis TaxID=34621 RepID=UPI003F5C229D